MDVDFNKIDEEIIFCDTLLVDMSPQLDLMHRVFRICCIDF